MKGENSCNICSKNYNSNVVYYILELYFGDTYEES